ADEAHSEDRLHGPRSEVRDLRRRGPAGAVGWVRDPVAAVVAGRAVRRWFPVPIAADAARGGGALPGDDRVWTPAAMRDARADRADTALRARVLELRMSSVSALRLAQRIALGVGRRISVALVMHKCRRGLPGLERRACSPDCRPPLLGFLPRRRHRV